MWKIFNCSNLIVAIKKRLMLRFKIENVRGIQVKQQ